MIFVDSGAWFASLVPTDPDYAAAVAWLGKNREPLLTTDYVVDETLTLLRARGQYPRAITLGTNLFSGAMATIYYVAQADIQLAWQIFRTFADKEWSFTDCTSKVVIEKLSLATAFSFDQHFHQFGSVLVVP